MNPPQINSQSTFIRLTPHFTVLDIWRGSGISFELREGCKVPQDQVFISFSHRDARWRDELETHLKPYRRTRSIISWSDQQIAPGSEWFTEIAVRISEQQDRSSVSNPEFSQL